MLGIEAISQRRLITSKVGKPLTKMGFDVLSPGEISYILLRHHRRWVGGSSRPTPEKLVASQN